MSKEERFDVVIVGGGHNGTTAAAYLAKCGLSVCVLEERPECGGAQETTEPVSLMPNVNRSMSERQVQGTEAAMLRPAAGFITGSANLL